MKGYSVYPKALALLEPHHQIIYRHNQDTHWVGLTSLQRSNQYILQPKPTEQGSCLGLGSLFNGISTLFRLFNAKAILQEEQ